MRPDLVVAFMPVAFGYGTTMRCLAVAEKLRRRGHRCVFLAGGSVREMIARYDFPVCPIPDVSIQPHQRELPALQLFKQESAPGFLSHQLQASVAALHDVRADLVVFSNNLTGALAAGVLDLPSISIFQPSIMEITSADLAMPMLFTWLRFLLVRAQSRLAKPVPSPFLGDQSFIPSLPSLIRWPRLVPPGLALRRDQVEPIGALLTQDPATMPPRGVLLDELGIAGTPFVYGTVGGAIFSLNLVNAVADGIRQAGCHGLVSGGSVVTREASARLSDDRVRVVSFVPDDIRAIKAADAIVWHGGHATMMEAVACGVPTIGLPFQLDQFSNVASIADFGAGLGLRPRGLRAQSLTRAIERVLGQTRFRQRMESLQQVNAGYGGAIAVADTAELLAGRTPVAGRVAGG